MQCFRSLPCPGSVLTRPTENICGNSTCPKTPEEAFFASEEAKDVPAESIHLERSRTARNARTYRQEPSRVMSQFISSTRIKSNTSFQWEQQSQMSSEGRAFMRSPSPKTYEKSQKAR